MWFDGLWLYGFRLRQTISWDEKQAIKFILEVSEILFKIQFPSDIGGQMNVLLEDNSFTIFAFKINLLRKNKLLQWIVNWSWLRVLACIIKLLLNFALCWTETLCMCQSTHIQYKEQKYDNNRYVRDVDTAKSWRLFEHIAHQKQMAFIKVALGAYD